MSVSVVLQAIRFAYSETISIEFLECEWDITSNQFGQMAFKISKELQFMRALIVVGNIIRSFPVAIANLFNVSTFVPAFSGLGTFLMKVKLLHAFCWL